MGIEDYITGAAGVLLAAATFVTSLRLLFAEFRRWKRARKPGLRNEQ